jgi:CheY-like chemotaxis protein
MITRGMSRDKPKNGPNQTLRFLIRRKYRLTGIYGQIPGCFNGV